MKRKSLVAFGAVAAVLVAAAVFFAPWSRKEAVAPATPTDVTSEIGQTLMIGVSSTTLTDADRAVIETVHPGGVILFSRNIRNATQTAKLVSDLQAAASQYSKLPLFIAVDEEGGEVSRLPWIAVKTGEPQIGSPFTAHAIAIQRAQALRAVGINMDLAPVLDQALPTDYLYGRTFQTSTTAAGALGGAMVSGYQSAGVLATLKHFPGYVGISGDPEAKLYSVLLPPIAQFVSAAKADPAFIMTANVVYPPLDPSSPFPLSPRDIAWLHEQVPGSYLVITDDLADPVMRTDFGVATSTVRAMQAGADVELVASGIPSDSLAAYDALTVAVKDGTIDPQTIVREYDRVVAAKALL